MSVPEQPQIVDLRTQNKTTAAGVTEQQRVIDVWLAETHLAEVSERWTEAKAGDLKSFAAVDLELRDALDACRRARRRLEHTRRRLEKQGRP